MKEVFNEQEQVLNKLALQIKKPYSRVTLQHSNWKQTKPNYYNHIYHSKSIDLKKKGKEKRDIDKYRRALKTHVQTAKVESISLLCFESDR